MSSFILGRIILHAEAFWLRLFAVIFAFTIATACAFVYAEEREITAELFDS